jgi:hypothetical protein
VTTFVSDSAPSQFGNAERAVRLPITVSQEGELFLGGILYEKEQMRRLKLRSGRYSVYSIGYNLTNRWPTETQMDLSDEEFSSLTNIERYDLVFVPGVCGEPEVLCGNAFLF